MREHGAIFETIDLRCHRDVLLQNLFEEQVTRSPAAVAVVYGTTSLSYAELNARANQLAHLLRARGVGPEQLVALCLERSLEMIVSVLAVLKAGGAYLPLDPSYPRERLAYMLRDAAPRVLLTQSHLRGAVPETTAQVIAFDEAAAEIGTQSTDNLEPAALGLHPGHLAYVIYTSGSTGDPKGVMVEHRHVTRLFAATEAAFGFGAQDVWTLFHSLSFDFSVWELWGGLLYGSRVVVVPYLTARSPREFYRLLCEERVTVLNQTPSAFDQLIEAQRVSSERHALRLVIFGGEALDLRRLRPWVSRNGVESPRLVNMYGITETTVHVTLHELTQEEIDAGQGSVGKPIADLRVYMLDAQRRVVPEGVTGEIYVGGAGVTRGYLNRPEFTAERFVDSPFVAGDRLYRSGDLGRYRADGQIEFLGRNDRQVKLRGYRIELGEIEARLAEHPQIRGAAVVLREDNGSEPYLAAYISGRDEEDPIPVDVRAHLHARLPAYMIPRAIIVMKALPRTPSGKLDRRALPPPTSSAYIEREYDPPRGEIESRLAAIWHEVLGIDRVDRGVSFFDVGGHSLLATQVLTRVEASFSIEAPLSVLFSAPTLEQMAAYISRAREESLLREVSGRKNGMGDALERVVVMSDAEVEQWLRDLGVAEVL